MFSYYLKSKFSCTLYFQCHLCQVSISLVFATARTNYLHLQVRSNGSHTGTPTTDLVLLRSYRSFWYPHIGKMIDHENFQAPSQSEWNDSNLKCDGGLAGLSHMTERNLPRRLNVVFHSQLGKEYEGEKMETETWTAYHAKPGKMHGSETLLLP